MGKGDKKSKRGKISSGSFGKRRPHKLAKSTPVIKEEKVEKIKTKSA